MFRLLLELLGMVQSPKEQKNQERRWAEWYREQEEWDREQEEWDREQAERHKND